VQVLHEVQVRTFRLLALTGEIGELNESVGHRRGCAYRPTRRGGWRAITASWRGATRRWRSSAGCADLYDSPFAIEMRGANDKLVTDGGERVRAGCGRPVRQGGDAGAGG